MNNLVLRSITGFFFVAVVLGSILINEFTATVVFSIFFVLGLIEFFQLFKNHKILSIPLKSSLTFGILIFGILVAILFGQLHLFFLIQLYQLLSMYKRYLKHLILANSLANSKAHSS